jgi:hypothetical protein
VCGLDRYDGLLLAALLFWLVWFILGGIRVGVQRVWTGRKITERRAEIRAIMGMFLPAMILTVLLVYGIACGYRVDRLPHESAELWPPSATSVGASARSSPPRRSPGR